MATPYLDEAERCGRVALLHDGRLLAIDRPAHLQAALAGQLLEVVGRRRAAAARACSRRSRRGRRAAVRRPRARPARRRRRRTARARDPGGARARGHQRRQRPADRGVARGCVHRPDCEHEPRRRSDRGLTGDVMTRTARCSYRACSPARGAGRRRTRCVRLTLDEAIARGLANSHRLAELQARRRGGRRGRSRPRGRDRCRRRAAGRLHAHQSRRRVRHRAAGPAAADHLSRRSGQLPRAARSAVAGLHRRPHRRARARGRAPSATRPGRTSPPRAPTCGSRSPARSGRW